MTPCIARIHQDAIEHLQRSHEAMTQLMGLSQDWTATTMLDVDFRHLETAIDDFGKHQLGLSKQKKKKVGV